MYIDMYVGICRKLVITIMKYIGIHFTCNRYGNSYTCLGTFLATPRGGFKSWLKVGPFAKTKDDYLGIQIQVGSYRPM